VTATGDKFFQIIPGSAWVLARWKMCGRLHDGYERDVLGARERGGYRVVQGGRVVWLVPWDYDAEEQDLCRACRNARLSQS
jgi:hypothetical protein